MELRRGGHTQPHLQWCDINSVRFGSSGWCGAYRTSVRGAVHSQPVSKKASDIPSLRYNREVHQLGSYLETTSLNRRFILCLFFNQPCFSAVCVVDRRVDNCFFSLLKPCSCHLCSFTVIACTKFVMRDSVCCFFCQLYCTVLCLRVTL